MALVETLVQELKTALRKGEISPIQTVEIANAPSTEKLTTYVDACTAVGLPPAADARDAEFVQFLQREEIPVYPYMDCMEHMKKRCERLNKDNPPIGAFGAYDRWTPRELQLPFGVAGPDAVSNPDSYYWDMIPVEALHTIKTVKEKFGEVKWCVLAPVKERVDPDPFLVAQAGKKQFVLGYWDEPGFSVIDKKGLDVRDADKR